MIIFEIKLQNLNSSRLNCLKNINLLQQIKDKGEFQMKKIMLVCSAGMSTSLLVTKMEQAAEKAGDEVEIFALPMSDGINRLSTVDCVLLGPQVRFNLGKIKEEAAKVNPGLPVDVIDMKDYGTMNGEKVYNYAKKLMDE